MTTRLMTRDDLDAVMEIERSSFRTPWTRRMFESDLNKSPARYIVAVEDDAVVGYAGMWFVLDEGQITNVAIHPEYRGRGLGGAMLDALMQLAADSGMTFMTLEVRRSNEAARRLYRSRRFIEVGCRKGYYEDTGEDAILMTAIDMPAAHPDDDPLLITEDETQARPE